MAFSKIVCFGGSKDSSNGRNEQAKEKESPMARRNREIDRQLREDQRRMAKEVKVLLLGMAYCLDPCARHDGRIEHTNYLTGAGESGKSTVLKQMRLIHTKGFAVQERKQWKVTIFQNLLHAFQVIFGAMEEQEAEFSTPENIVRALRPPC